MCGQMHGQTPTFFCGPSGVQAEGEDAGSKTTSSKRAVGGGEGDQRGGWDRNTSLRAPCLCPATPASRSALLCLWLWDLLPQVQIQLTGQLPWGTTNLGRVSGSLFQAPGAFHAPRWPGAAPHQAVGSLRAGMGFILGGIHPWLSSTASTGLHTWWVSLQVFFLNEPSIRSSPGCSPWVRYLVPSSRI